MTYYHGTREQRVLLINIVAADELNIIILAARMRCTDNVDSVNRVYALVFLYTDTSKNSNHGRTSLTVVK